MVTLFLAMLPSVKFAEEKVFVFFILREKYAKIVQFWVWHEFLTIIFRADWSDKSEWYCRTVHCLQNIWFNKWSHPNEHRNAYWLSTNCVLASDQSSV